VQRAWCALLLLAGCGSSDLPAQSQLVFVGSGASLPPGCAAEQSDTLFQGSAVEPMIAADPRDPLHLCGVWQQDRFSDSGSAALLTACTFDGGKTWTAHSSVPYSRCAGGTLERASDPWIAFAPDGTVHQIGLAFNESNAAKSILASRSTDGGRTWSPPIALQSDTSPQFAMDKETITADSNDPNYVYAVWDRLDGPLNPPTSATHGPTWFARSTDGGQTWEPARLIVDTPPFFQTIGNQIVVLPGGRVVDVFTFADVDAVTGFQAQVIVSDDHGSTWSTPIDVATQAPVVVTVSRWKEPVRTGSVLPSAAVDPSTGQIYVAWENALHSSLTESTEGIALARSDDGGATWSQPVRVNGRPEVEAFTPVVSAANGVVAVSYYDLRDDIGELFQTRVSHWLATSTDSGQTFTDTRLSEPFALQSAPYVGGFFLGDYMGLTHVGGAFLPFFVVTAGDHSDVVFRPSPGAPALKSAPVAASSLASWLGTARKRFGTR
jgi:hypothetical protein